MGGSGGGASGSVTYPTYLQTFHGQILDHTATDSPTASFIDAYNVAYGNSPFSTAVAYDPDAELANAAAVIAAFNTAVLALNYNTDFTTANGIARGLFPAGITSLDSTTFVAPAAPYAPPTVTIGDNPSTLDSTTLDTTTQDIITPANIAADIAALDAVLTNQIEQEELPRFKAGMLNINAVHSSAFVIGEALIRANKDRILVSEGLKVQEQVREINARHTLSYKEITAKHALSYREITARQQQSYRELTSRDSIATKEINARHLITVVEQQSRHQELYREDILRLQLAQMEIDARHKTTKQEIDAKFYMHKEELVRMSTVAMMADLMKKMDLEYQHAHISTEFRRLSVVARKEEIDEQLAIDESDAKWDMDLFRYAGIVMAAPSGGVAQGNERKSKAVSAIGGAVSGAAAGAVTGAAIGAGGGPYGAAIGAVVGIGLALLS
jgi:hypothetical protein